MPDLKISNLPAAAPLTGSELTVVVQSGQTDKTTVQTIADFSNKNVNKFVDEYFTVTGNTQTISFTPSKTYGHYMNGQKLRVGGGGRIVSIVGALITFDDDYTGSILNSVYEKP